MPPKKGMPIVSVEYAEGCVLEGVNVSVMVTVGVTVVATVTMSHRGPNPSATVSRWTGSSQRYVSG